MKELRERETKALSEEDYELGIPMCTSSYCIPSHGIHQTCLLYSVVLRRETLFFMHHSVVVTHSIHCPPTPCS